MGSIIFSFRNFRKAFTLIELMIVISIIGVLTVALIPQMSQYMNRSRDAERLSNMSNIQLALEQYKVENKIYPTHSGGCAPTNTLITGKYLTKPSSSPSGVTYNEGCGNNGEFGYGRRGGNGYILMSIMENPQGGNYSGSTAGFTGVVSDSGVANTANIVKGAGKVYLRATSSIIASAATVTIDPPEAGVCGVTANTCNLGTSTGYSAGSCGGFQTWYCDGLNGGATSPQCQYANVVCSNCTLSGTTVVHGGSTPAYLAPNVTSPATCGAPITRNCTNGTLDGNATYAYPTCVQGDIVTFDGNGGSGHSPTVKNIAHSAVLGTLPGTPPNRTGYTFNGWFTLSTGGTAVTASTPINGNVTFYAQWTAVGYTVSGSFGANGSGATITGCSGKNATADASGNFSFGLVNNGTNCTDIIATRATYTCSTAMPGPASLSSNFTTVAGTCTTLPAFTTTWKVGTAGYGNGDNTIAFNVAFSGTNYSIDWGDGTVQTLTTTTPSHTYATAGDKTVKIIGGLQRFYNASWNSNYFGKLTAVTDWGNMSWTSMQQMFFYANHFNNIPVTAPDLTNVTSMQQMFWVASVFNQSLNAWNTSSVTNMNAMFWLAEGFNNGEASGSSTTPLNWNTSSVTNMGEMFGGATAFNQPLNSWNVSNVIDMNNMFYNATAFNQPLNSWNTSSVTNMHMMFGQAYEFNQPLNSWNVSNVTDMGAMFRVATKFNQDISSWNTTKVGNMTSMFSDASAFNQNIHTWCVPLIATKSSAFDTNSNAGFLNQTAKQPQWGGCSYTVTFDGNGGTGHTPTSKLVASGSVLGALPTNPAQAGYSFSGWYTAMTGGTTVTAATVISTGATFYAQWTPLPAFTTTWKVGTFGYGDGNRIVEFDIVASGSYTVDWGDGVIQILSVATPYHFYATNGNKVIKITGNIQSFSNPYLFDDSVFGKLIAVNDWGNMSWTNMSGMFDNTRHLTSLPITPPNLSNVTDMSSMFARSSINQDISSWDVSHVTNMSSMFMNAFSFDQPLNSWNVSNVTDMNGMFYGTFFDQPLNSWDVSNVTDMNGMFGFSQFNNNISTWNVSSVVNMASMFAGSTFNQDISAWNVSSVIDMSFMFYSSSFNQSLNLWNTISTIDMSNMFNSSSFNQPLSSWNTSNVVYMNNMFFLSYFNQNISAWNVSSVIDMQHMFSHMSFNQPLNSWDTSSVMNMNCMFMNNTSFNQPLGNWNTSSVTDMDAMFYGATSFNQPINSWNMGNVTNMYSMFNRAAAFNQPLNSWNTSKVTDMGAMFYSGSAFNQNISSWCVPLIGSKPTDFDLASNAGFLNQAAKQPQWGTCPVVITGSCGSANGVATASYPTTNWCTTGTKVDVDTIGSDGAYNWSCNGSGGGTNVSCSANKQNACESLGGTTVNLDGTFCRFNQSHCPSGWAPYKDWTETIGVWGGSGGYPTCGGCYTNQHSFSNTSVEVCTYDAGATDEESCNWGPYSLADAYATISKVGCIQSTQLCSSALDISLGNGQVWKACNIGATYTWDFGNIYQWGRNVTTFTPSPSSPYDWQTPQNSNSWGGISTSDINGTYSTVSAANKTLMQGPCPLDYHIPTAKEWSNTLSLNHLNGLGRTLNLPAGGEKDLNGNYSSGGGFYWTSTPSPSPGIYAGSSQFAYMEDNYYASTMWIAGARGGGMYVRCLKNPSISGSCGSANGVSTTVYPTANWCTTGTKADIDTVGSDGAYDWSCNGSGGGSSVNCSANGTPYSYKNGDTNYGGTVYISGAPPTYVLKAILPNQAGLTAADLGKACTMVDRVWGNGTKVGTISKLLQYECSAGGAVNSPTYNCTTPGPTGPGNYTCPVGSLGKWASKQNGAYGSCQVVTDASKATGLGC